MAASLQAWLPLGSIIDWWQLPHRDVMRFADLLPVLRAQFVVAIADGVRFGMADLKDDTTAIAAWDRLIAQANSRPIFPTGEEYDPRSEEEIVDKFDNNLWLAQMLQAGIAVPASMLEQADGDGAS